MVAQTVKNLPAMQETRVQSLGQEDPLEEEMATGSSVLACEPHGQGGLVGCSPWGGRDTAEQLTRTQFIVSAVTVQAYSEAIPSHAHVCSVSDSFPVLLQNIE